MQVLGGITAKTFCPRGIGEHGRALFGVQLYAGFAFRLHEARLQILLAHAAVGINTALKRNGASSLKFFLKHKKRRAHHDAGGNCWPQGYQADLSMLLCQFCQSKGLPG